MESSAIAVLVPTVTTQNGVMAAETLSTPGSDGTPSPFGRMLSDATGPSPQATSQATAEAVVAVTLPLSVQLAAEMELKSASAASAGSDAVSLLSDRGGLSALLAFQAVTPLSVENGGIAQGDVEPAETGQSQIPASPVQADAGETVAVRRNPEEISGEGQKVSDSSVESSGLLLASAMQSLQLQASSPAESQKRPDPVIEVRQEATFGVTSVAALASTSPQATAGAAVTASSPAPAAGTAEPASQASAAVAAGVGASLDRTSTTTEGADSDQPIPAKSGDERPVQAVPSRSPRPSLRGGHDRVSTQKGEVPAPATDGPVFDRPLLEVVVEEAGSEASAEVAAKPAGVEANADAMVAVKPTQSLIGGAVAVKAEPAPLPAAGEAVRAPGHEQIMAQVKEQLGKAEFRADDGRVVLRLHPEELGSLRIDVKMDDQRLRLHIVAENPTVREALVANLDSLRESLSKQQIVMERFDVATGQGQDQQLFREHRQQVQDGQQHRPNRFAAGYDEDDEVSDRRAKTAYWAPQDGSLLSVRF